MRGAARVLTAEEAVALIPSDATVGVGGFVGAGHPELLTAALERRFLQSCQPTGLTLIYGAGQGDRGERGLNHLAHEGLLRRAIGGHWGLAPRLGQLAMEGRIEAYNLPQGVLCALFREIAARRPGLITKVGLNTFIDPRNTGGRLNARTTEPLVERLTLDGAEWLRYRSVPIHVALLRGTRADRAGNVTMEREGTIGEVLPLAQAAKNHGGLVLVQVEEIVDVISDPKAVRLPGILVDALVVSPRATHWQTFGAEFNPAFVQRDAEHDCPAVMAFSERKIIARRALQEIQRGNVVNLGIGLPEGVASVAGEEGRLGEFTLSVESGPIGGLPAGGLDFGCSFHPEAVVDQPSQFDFMDGGGLDIAILGAASVDREGNVDVSSIGGRFVGVGGFVNITTSARRLVFCATFRAGGLQVAADAGGLQIVAEGRHCKFVERVERVCFHGPTALAQGRPVFYVTERAVFRLAAGGLELVELAPGVDLQRQVLALMEFAPLVNQPRAMAGELFRR